MHKCGVDEGDCDSNDECKSHLFCGSKNCPFSLFQEPDDCSSICGFPDYKGDDYCDDENNNCGCEWDGGDCCGSNVNTNYCAACECLEPTLVDCCEPKGEIILLGSYISIIVHII